MVFIPDYTPPPDQHVDTSDNFEADAPFSVKQAAISSRRHRWFEPIVVGQQVDTYTISPGLPGGKTQRIQFDNKPDFVIVSLSGGNVTLFSGDPGGPGIPIGPGGSATIPGPQGGVVSLVNAAGGSTANGAVIAVAGYTDPGIAVSVGAAAPAVADTASATASVVAPGANAGIVSVPVAAGVYDATFTVWLNGGAPAAGDMNNVYINATGSGNPRLPVVPAANVPITTGPYRITIPAGGGAIGVNASGAGTAGVAYVATVIARKVG